MYKRVKQLAKRILNRMRGLAQPMPSRFSNFDYNRQFFDQYAREWNNRNISKSNVDDPVGCTKEPDTYIHYLGDEWGRKEDIEEIVKEFISPFIWKNFSKQDRYNPIHHYFISPEIVKILAERTGFRI